MHELVFFYPQGHEAHVEPGHPERPERVEAIRETLVRAGLWQISPHLKPLDLPEEILNAIHTPEYLQTLERVSRKGANFDMDTYTTPASWELALNAAGGAAVIASTVWQDIARRGFALTRPPGHHATRDRALGFCLLNNVALAAEYLLQQDGAESLAIVGPDLHHGNRTQDIFYRRGGGVFLLIHQEAPHPRAGG